MNIARSIAALTACAVLAFADPAAAFSTETLQIHESSPLPVEVTTSPLSPVTQSTPRQVSEGARAILDQVRARRLFGQVRAGFMECNEPDIPTAIDQCVAEGARRVIAVPYFLHTGKHVANDLPGLLEEARARHPRIEFLMSSYVGTSCRVTEILQQRARAAQPA